MKRSTAFRKAVTTVVSYPVYIIFFIVLLVYAVLGNRAEALLLFGALAVSVLIRALYLTSSVFPPVGNAGSGTRKGTMEKLRTISFRISLAAVFCAVPLLIVSLVTESEGGIALAFSRILGVMSLGLSVFSGAPGSPLEFTVSLQLLPENREEPNLSMKTVGAAEKLAGCSHVLILNPLLLYDNTQEVRSVFYAGANYRGMSLAESPMKTPAEICYLISAFVQSVSSGRALTLPEQRENALDTFAQARLPERQALSFFTSDFLPYYDRLYPGDIAVRVRSEQGTYIAYRTSAPDALRLCGYQRTAEGEAKELDSYAEKALHDAVAAIRAENLVPYIYMTFPGAELPRADTDRGVLEAVIAVGGVCPGRNADVTETMEDFGVTPILVLPAENATSRGFALSSGICSGEEQIALYSAFSEGERKDPKYLEGKKALLGFPREELLGAVRTISGSCEGICVVPREAADLALMNMSKTAVAVEKRCDAAVAQVADSSVLPADLRDARAGLPSLFSLLSEASTLLCKMTVVRNILLTYGSFLLCTFAVALFCGADAILPSAFQILLCGTAVSACAALVVAEDKAMMQNRSALETDPKAIRTTCIRCALLGLLMALAVCLCGMLAFADTPLAARNYMFTSLVTCGIAVPICLRLSDRRRYGVTGWNWTAAVCACIGLGAVLFLSFVRMPELLYETFGTSAFPWKNLLFALIPAAVPFVSLGIQAFLRRFPLPMRHAKPAQM